MQEYCRISSFEAMYYAKFCFVGATGSSPATPGERGEKVDTLTVYDRAFRAIIIILNYYG